MERLTIKNKDFNDYSVAEHLRNQDVRQYIYSINQKMGKIEDLEERNKMTTEQAFDKAKAFDVLKELNMIDLNNERKALNVEDGWVSLTDEQYETLKKAGVK